MDDIRQAALATLAPPPDRRTSSTRCSAPGSGARRRVVGERRGRRRNPHQGRWRRATSGPAAAGDSDEGGECRRRPEQLATRDFRADDASLAAFRRALPQALPTRRSFRTMRAARAAGPTCGARCARSSAPTATSPRRCCAAGSTVQRRLLLLIDISGSMKLHTRGPSRSLRMPPSRRADRAEVFTLRHAADPHHRGAARRATATARWRASPSTVEDWDGGTRIGPTLLALPLRAALCRLRARRGGRSSCPTGWSAAAMPRWRRRSGG